ncbi:centriolin isoform X2 [Brachyhypopomus gauderio]|uniref:centriolin isoform X2 n=1 Tax=Brachyhypopomus gauderio TaxID=698409 RepID=UPI00404107B0
MERRRTPNRVLKKSTSPVGGHSRGLTSAFMKSASHLDLTGDCKEAANDGQSDNDERKCMGTKYITEDLIKKLTKQENLSLLQSLNLSNTHGDKCFRYIENLDKCTRLQILNLSNNSIEKIEKLDKLHKLRELHISNNRIQKIEGLEHMLNLQILNLANNSIEQVPVWLAKKLRSLQMLNLQNNKIFSLHEVAKLKPLQNLTELTLVENPVSSLSHYRLFILFHLRSLESLDGQRISDLEREQAHHRFHTEEMVRLERELEQRGAEVERLQQEKAAALEELEEREMLQQTLKQQCKEQLFHQQQLERELDTKSELLKQKSAELTRACHKQYELEQELAFHKIDAKFEPLPYCPSHELEEDSLPADSPYIGKARHKRSVLTTDTIDVGDTHRVRRALPHRSESEEAASGRVLTEAEQRLQQLNAEAERTQREILRASKELRHLEEAASQKRLAEAEKEQLRQKLCGKIQRLEQLRQEAVTLEEQRRVQGAELDQAQGALEQLQTTLRSLQPQDPRHTHVKAQVASESQALAVMSRRQHELEERLDDVLTRITKETQEIKDLEQQLTDGQIAVNEALKRDLEGVISGLQEYLHGGREQARRDLSACLRLQTENKRLLQDGARQLGLLQEAARNSDATKEELVRCQERLEDLRKENVGLREAQGRAGVHQAELEVQLRDGGEETSRLREKLDHLHRLSQVEHSALRAEVQEERRAKESVLSRLQLAAEREMENSELLLHLAALQREKTELTEEVEALQSELQRVRGELLSPERVVERLAELRRSVAGSPEVFSRAREDGDALGESMEELRGELERTLRAAHRERDEARHAQDRLAREVASLRERLRRSQQEHRRVCAEAEHTRATKKREEEAELIRLREELQEAQEKQYQMLQRLQEVESERDRLLTELKEQDKQIKAEETQTQEQLQSLDLELQDLRRSFTAADLMTSTQLQAAKDQLRSLHSTVHKIGQERAEDAEELEESRRQAVEAMHELTKAETEIHTLQELLQDRVNVINRDCSSVPHSSIDPKELARLNRILKRQQAQTRRLRDQLARAKEDNSGSVEELLEEIAALRGTLLQENHTLNGPSEVPRTTLNGPSEVPCTTGYWCYVPPHQNPPSLGSLGTQDSGLGSQPPPSTHRGRDSRGRLHKKTRPRCSAGHWLYPSDPHDPHVGGEREPPYGDSDGESDDGDGGAHFTPPPGSVIYTTPPDDTPLPQATVIYAPPLTGLPLVPGAVFYGPPEGARLVDGPPPCSLPVPVLPTGTLLCNVPGHQDLERSLREAERALRGRQQSGRVVSERELLTLEEQRSQLQLELEKLQRAVRRLRRHRRLLESSVSQTEEERSVQEEAESLETSLLKRRAQLREADHLLQELDVALKDTTAKNKESVQRRREAERQLEETQRELEVTEQRTRDSARHLVQANQQLRDLQEELKEKQRCKQDQENALRQIEKLTVARNVEFQEVSRKLERASTKLEELQKSCHHSEELQRQHKKELEHLNTQTLLQQEELSLLGRKLEQWREEEVVVRARVDRDRQGLADLLRRGGEEGRDLQQRIKELHTDVQALAVQKGEMDSQLSERKNRLCQYKKEEQQVKESLQDLHAVLSKHKAELKNVLEMIQLENRNLEGVKVQHRHKLDQLEKSQDTLLQVQAELQEQREEQERQRRLQEQQTLILQEQTDAAAAQRNSLLGQCSSLEARHTLAQRSLEEARGGAQAAEAELLKLQEELTRLKREHRNANSIREEISRDTATVQQQLEEESEELKDLKEKVAQSQLQLDKIVKEVEDARRDRDHLTELRQESEAQLQERTEQVQKRQQRVDRLQQQLDRLEAAVAQKRAELDQQEEHAKTRQQQSLEVEELQRYQQQKLQCQLQALEGALHQRVEDMEQVTAAVEELEEKKQRLQAEQQRCGHLQDRVAALEDELAEKEAVLRAGAEEQREVRGEREVCRQELQRLQDTLTTERRRREALRIRSLGDREKLKQAEKERERLQKELELVDHAAQENHDRSRLLQHELSSASQEMQCLRHELRSRGEEDSPQREMKDPVPSPRPEVEAQLDGAVMEQPAASSDTESLKENQPLSGLTVAKADYNTKDEQWRGEVLRERLRQHEDHLKAQLRRSIFSQQEALCLRRQQTEGSIQGLRRRVDKLDQLLGRSDHASSHLSDPEVLHKYVCFDTESSSHRRRRERSLSPVRLDRY